MRKADDKQQPARDDVDARVVTVRARCLDIKAAAEYLGVSDDTVLRLINTATLPIVKFPVQNTSRGVDPRGVNRRVLLDVHDLDALIDQSKETRGGPSYNGGTSQAAPRRVSPRRGA